MVPSESAAVVELPTCGKTSGVSLNRAVFNAKTVPIAREDFAEWVEMVELWAGNESVHGKVWLGLFLTGFPSV